MRIVAGARRRQPRQIREGLPNNGDINLDNEHIDPNASDSEEEGPRDNANRVWHIHDTRQPAQRRGLPDGVNNQQPTKPPYNGNPRGPRNIPEGIRGPKELFSLFFTDNIMSRFVEATNAYGRKYYNRWQDCTIEELFKLFGDGHSKAT